MRVFELFGRPTFLKGFHGWLTIVWGALIPITVFTDLKGSIVWVALMSVWANFVGHWSAWQATRVEVELGNDDSQLAIRAVDVDAQPDRGQS